MKIKKCRSCNASSLVKIISLGNQFLSDFTKTNKKPRSFPLNLVLCKNCFLVQLDYTAPSKYLYTKRYGYKSGINQTMQNELKEITKEALRKVKRSGEKLVTIDIGANDGTLLKNYSKSIYRIGVEPITKFAKECKKSANEVLNDFFTFESFNKRIKVKKADLITIVSCFYDMEDPNKFIDDVKKLLNENGVIVIQQNYLVEMLRLNAFDNIVHEHLEYYSLLSLSNLLHRHGLEVFDVKLNSLNGGSFRTYISFHGKKKISKSVKNLADKEKALGLSKKKIYKDFAQRINDNKKTLFSFIKKVVGNGKTVYLYGASTRGNTLLQFLGLDNRLIKRAVERNPEKWGKIIASVGIPIISEEQARKEKPDYMLVLPWFFKEEFLRREKKYLRSGGHFIFPLPKFQLI
jgi:NDP-4-keto-2,6-dideoxyhexose 3-C-methyltransferase